MLLRTSRCVGFGLNMASRMLARACRVIVLVALVTPAGSIMFDLPSGKVKCFSDDLPAHTMVVRHVSVLFPPAFHAFVMPEPGPAVRAQAHASACCSVLRHIHVILGLRGWRRPHEDSAEHTDTLPLGLPSVGHKSLLTASGSLAVSFSSILIASHISLAQEGKFSAEAIPEGQNRMPVEIQVTDPMEKVLFSKNDIESKQATFAFTTSVAGDYIVCFHNKGIAEFMTQRRVTFTMVHGIDARDYSQVMQTEHLTKLQVALREMQDRTDEIREEFAQEKQRERYMRDLSEKTCSRVLWFGVFTLIMCVGTSLVQYSDLYKVLKKGKYID